MADTQQSTKAQQPSSNWFTGMWDKYVDGDNDPPPKTLGVKDILDTKDEIENQYKFQFGTKSYKAIIKRMKAFSKVSSPTETNKRANFYVVGSHVMKPISVYLSYLSGMSHLKTVDALLDWQKEVISWALAIGAELIFSKESSAMFNRTEVPLTRITGAILGAVTATAFFWFHLKYIDQEIAHANTKNTASVIKGGIVSPNMVRLKADLDSVNQKIKNEEQFVNDANKNRQNQRDTLQAEMDSYLSKAKTYQELVDNFTANPKQKTGCKKKKGRARIIANGSCNYVSSVTSWANAQRAKAKKVANELALVENFTSAKIDNLITQRQQIYAEITKESNTVIAHANSVSSEGLDVLKVLLIIMEIMSKLDLYGYFLFRANIKKEIIEKMHSIIDEYSSLSQVQGIIDQLSRQGSLILKGVGMSVQGINESIDSINSTNLLSMHSHRESRNSLLLQLIGHIDKTHPQAQTANYVPIGDKDVDVNHQQPTNNELTKAEKEAILTDYTRESGYPDYTVILTDFVKVGKLDGNIIKLNAQLSDADLEKALLHELGHIESKTNKHDKTYKKGLEKAKEKTKMSGSTLSSINNVIAPSRQIDIMHKFFNPENGFILLSHEIEFFKKLGIWDNVTDTFNNETVNHATFFEALQYGE